MNGKTDQTETIRKTKLFIQQMLHQFTKHLPKHKVNEIKSKLIAKYGRYYQKNIIIKYVKKFHLAYFFNTGNDVHNGRIIKRLEQMTANVQHKAVVNMYNATIELDDFELARLSDRLEVRYKDRRFYKQLHRELNDNGFIYSYAAVTRIFTTFKDTSGGRLFNAINDIVNSK